jgi:hypothetical protein
MRVKRSILGILGVLAWMLMAVFATGPANAAAPSNALTTHQVTNVEPAASVFGCPSGWVCMYTDAGFNAKPPQIEHKYFNYGCYNLSNEFGNRAIVNNQTGGAKVSGYNNGGCTSRAWTFAPSQTFGYRVDITPINSISLNP